MLAPFPTWKITGPGDVVEFSQADTTGSKFSFTAGSEGSHKLCFLNGGGQKRTVEFEWASGAAAIDYGDVAKVEQLKPLELEMRKLEDRLTAVRKEMQFQREREEAHRDTVSFFAQHCLAATLLSIFCTSLLLTKHPPHHPIPISQSEVAASRIMWFSLLTIVLVFAQCVLQVWHLRGFVVQNKFLGLKGR